MNTHQSIRLFGRYFQGVVSSRGASPDASQDVAKVFPERARIVVADGAGDSGAAAGEWAGVLALCYGSGEGPVLSLAPEWLGRAVKAWSHASNLSRFTAQGARINQQELALLRHGVDASFIGATFDSRDGVLAVHWAAAGDCEAFLFRGGQLHNWGPIRRWKDFSSTASSLNSAVPQPRNLLYNEWQLEEGDVFILCSDALAQFILKECNDGEQVPDDVCSLMRCTAWQDLRQHIEAWRQARKLRNDDVAIVRVSIHRGQGAGRFSLTQELGREARAIAASPAPEGEAPSEPLVVAAPNDAGSARPAGETPGPVPDEARAGRPALSGILGSFVVGLLVGAMLKWAWLPLFKVAEHGGGVEQKSNLEPVEARPSEVIDPLPQEPAPIVESRPEPQPPPPTAAVISEEANGGREDAVAARDPGRSRGRRTTRVPAPAVPEQETPRDVIANSAARGEELRAREGAALGRLEEPAAAPPSTTIVETSSRPVGDPPQVESGPAAAAPESSTEEESRELAQRAENASEASAQPEISPLCTLPLGTEVYRTAKREKWPLLRVEASRVKCAIVDDTAQEGQRVTIGVWVDAGRTDAERPAWLSEGRISEPTNVRTAPPDDPGSEHLGNVQRGTTFGLGRREEQKGHLWVELIITGYLPGE